MTKRGVYFWSSFAILLIAILLVSTSGNAQNNDASAKIKNDETAERERIDQDRRAAAATYAAEKTACYQQFAVTGCLNQASSAHRTRISDLKRQEVSLNDTKRKRQGVDQLQRSEEKASVENQQAISAQRGKSLVQDAKRNERLSQQDAQRLERAKVALNRQKEAAAKQAKHVKKSQQRQAKNVKAALAAQRSAVKTSQAQAHREELLQKQQHTQKSAAPLPVPQ